MEHDYIQNLKEKNITLKLLRLDNAPLIISFLFKIFKKSGIAIIKHEEILSKLNDYLFFLNENGNNYLLSANEYLKKWADDGYLRSWYDDNNNILYELTPSTEKAIDIILDLEKKDFIGTESKLINIYSILKDIAYKNFSSDEKLKELEKKKLEIEKEIERIKEGKEEKLDITKIKELYLEAEENARRLLSDFKQIEENFRELDKSIREKQIRSRLPKGKILDEIFSANDLIWNSDQGKSFKSFWELLMSSKKQEELEQLIDIALSFKEIKELDSNKNNILKRLKVNLIEAGEKVNSKNALIIQNLRKFLSIKTYTENQRIAKLISSIENIALKIRNNVPENKSFIEIEDKVKIDLVMERPLYNPPKISFLEEINVDYGSISLVDTNSLYKQNYVEINKLNEKINSLLINKEKISLKELIDIYPISGGLAELVAYFNISSKRKNSKINESFTDIILVYNEETNKYFEVKVPELIFYR